MFKRVAGVVVFISMVLVLAGAYWWMGRGEPAQADGWTLDIGTGPMVSIKADLDILTLKTPELTSVVYDANGGILADLHGAQDRQPVPLKDISMYARDAVIAIEDRRFYQHEGVDTTSIIRAFFTNLAQGGISQGGSTITQQLAKNAVVGDEVLLERKIREASVALQLEAQYSKDEILEHYLNLVYFGGGAHGIKAAAERWFGVKPSELTIEQSALLAAMLKSSRNYHPVFHPKEAKARRDLVIKAMRSEGFISDEQAQAAIAKPLDVRKELDNATPWKAPYAVSYLLQQMQHDDMFQVLGSTQTQRAYQIFSGGLQIHTTIDPTWQHAAEVAAAKIIPLESKVEVGIVAQDPATGRIKALVGGLHPYDPTNATASYNMATQAHRQAGSSFKTVVLAAAIEQGKRLDDVYSAPTTIGLPLKNGTTWTVSNAGHVSYGHLDLRAALALSANTAFAQLIMDVGTNNVLAMAAQLGIASTLPPVPSVALGAGEVTVLDMSTAMATLASGGTYHKPTVVDYVASNDGTIIWQNPETAVPNRISTSVTWATTRAMQAVVEEGTGRAARIGRPLAGKTGTTQNYADAWFVGFTPQMAMAVWTGVPEGQVSMVPPVTPAQVNGGTWPAQIFRDAALGILADAPITPFAVPKGQAVTVKIDKNRGCLPNQWTPLNEIEAVVFPKGQEPKLVCKEPSAPVAINVPPVMHMRLDAAYAELAKYGLRVIERYEFNLNYPPNIVIAQTPEAGNYAKPENGLTVTLTISSATASGIKMPDVTGLSVAGAREALPDFKGPFNAVARCPDDDPLCLRGESGSIWAQLPKAGQPLGDKDRVVLSVYP